MKEQIEKQAIKEMAKVIECAITETTPRIAPANYFEALLEAEALYSAGYRKQSEVIDEFAERLKKSFNFGHTILEKSICDIIDQVLKEMTEEVK